MSTRDECLNEHNWPLPADAHQETVVQKSKTQELDFNLLNSDFRVTGEHQVLKSYGITRVAGEQRAGSPDSDRPESIISSVPELTSRVATPFQDDLSITTPGTLHTDSRSQSRQAVEPPGPVLRTAIRELRAARHVSSSTNSTVSKRSSAVGSDGQSVLALSDIVDVHESTRTSIEREFVDLFEAQHPSHSISRARSLTSISKPAAAYLGRRQSLSDLGAQQPYVRPIFETSPPASNLNDPTVQSHIAPANRKTETTDEDEISPAAANVAVIAAKEETGSTSVIEEDHVKPNIWTRTKQSVIATYAPRVPPPLVLPTGPTDAEKLSYLSTQRFLLYSFGVFSFLSLSAGMWLFTLSAVAFYWFGLVVFVLQAYLFVSYAVSLFGKDWDYKSHQKTIEDYPILDDTAPTVDVYLPCCKEPLEILENTYKHVKELKYPVGKLKVWVLDDGASAEVEALAQKYEYNYICREDRPRLKKAGNLRWAFARTDGDYFAIYDADFCPRPDFLLETIPVHLADPKAAIIQTPQFFRTLDQQTWVEQGAGAVQELFYRVIQVNRDRWGAAICVGSNAVYRREALAEVGGTAEIGFSEDVHTGFYALTRGWKVKYMPLCLACGICPDTPRAFFSQQMRWCMGSTTLLSNPEFWKSNLTIMQKICYLSGMMYYSAIAMSIFFNPLPGILMIWIRPDYVRYYNLAFAIPSLIYTFIAIRAWAKASYGFNVQFVMAIQNYAYLTAIKDRMIGRGLAWVPSGDTKGHKNNKYRNMRILAWVWMLACMGTLISGITYQCIHGMPVYDIIPITLLTCFNFFLAHRFLLCHGKL